MIKNPYINALVAGAYIVGLVSFMSLIGKIFAGTQDNILMPMTALSLLVFSVALMAVLFFYEPVMLIIDNKKNEALSFFTKTLATFFGVLIIFFVLMVYISIQS